MNPSSSLFDFSRFGDAPALIDRTGGRVVRYSELEFPASDFPKLFTTCERSTFDHAFRLLAALRQGCVVAPISFRLPGDEAGRRGEEVARRMPEGPGTVLFTSGSSGKPRGVWHSLDAHIANARGAAGLMPLQPGDGWLLSLPLHHVSGFSILVRCLLSGAAVVFPNPAVPLEQQVSDPAVTHVSVVSTQLLRLVEAGADLSGLKAVLAGGGPFPEALVARAIQAGAPIHLTYGMTEAASQIATSGRLSQVPSPLHCGRALAGREVRISADGMIQVRGPVVSPDVLDGEGWFSTGDLGRFDGEGNIVILGRRDRMFISGGENIHPEAVEVLLAEAPGVERAAVVGVPDAEFGMRPVAFVCGEFREGELREYLRSRLEAFAVPDRFLGWPEGVEAREAKVDYRALERVARGVC